VLKELTKKMDGFAKDNDYEQAARYRDLISKYNYVRQRYKLPEIYMENPTFVDDRAEESLKSLAVSLPTLKKSPKRIECYDISNISGTDAVGSMVVAEGGKITKKEYKRFKIKYKKTPDDFEMIYEVISRRSNHKDSWPVPDLLLIDGGKGQVSAAEEAVKNNSWGVVVVGLAKREETIIYRDGLELVELKLDKNDVGLKLLMRLRDEAHRFAQAYHHKLRAKSLLT